jgi:hypothetical protein
MSTNFIAFFLWVTTEYNYLSAFANYFHVNNLVGIGGEEDAAIVRFMGKCFSYISIANMIFGLTLYSRIVRLVGIGGILLLSPLLYLTTYIGWFVWQTLAFPIMGFAVVEGTSEIVEDTNTSLLLKNEHSSINSTTRVLAESLCEPLGMLASGIFLSFPQVNSLSLGMCLALFSLVVAFFLRHQFRRRAFTTPQTSITKENQYEKTFGSFSLSPLAIDRVE